MGQNVTTPPSAGEGVCGLRVNGGWAGLEIAGRSPGDGV